MLGWILALVIGWWPHACVGDVNGDRVVNILDGSIISANYLQTVPPGTRGDLNADGVVNMGDIDIWVANFGHICTVNYVVSVAADGN